MFILINFTLNFTIYQVVKVLKHLLQGAPKLQALADIIPLRKFSRHFAPGIPLRSYATRDDDDVRYRHAKYPRSHALQDGIKITNEPPVGLKANIIGSYRAMPSAVFSDDEAASPGV